MKNSGIWVRVAFAVLWLLHFLPLSVLARCGEGLGLLLFLVARRRRRIALINLQLCFPDMTPDERRRLARRHFMALGRSILERGILQWSSQPRIERIVRVEGLSHWQSVRDRPVILLAPHFVGMDMGGVRLTTQWQMVSMYKPQGDPAVDRFLRRIRERFGGRLVSVDQGFRFAIGVMQKGWSFYYLPDLDLGRRKAVFVPFFGVPAATVTALSRLARVTGAVVVPCVTRQLPGAAGYAVQLYSAWSNYPHGDAIEDARRMNAFIEERVREMPEQYYWVHRRFKTLPEGGQRAY
ncbi:MAG: lysophospholipid acyltransferase family protein [Chromatiales bacterium]